MRIRPILAAGLVLLATACTGGGDQATGQSTAPATEDAVPPEQRDRSVLIPGIEIKAYNDPQHVRAPQRVAYDESPPFGGTHDASWAACTGVVYTKPVRNENMVHALEHGAVWIAYNPETLPAAGVEALAKRVTGVPYMVMSPYPGLDKPVSLQSWGHRLKLDDPADPRVEAFVSALKQNRYTHPEPGAPCENPTFDQENPPPFDPAPAPDGSAPVGS
ncbi:DUF3105 domain-containing protein [Kibdelosporangium persicum]|uniref:DUF3105 domain-containing protein n=1 Tax=Kibdelosporangium persicum TaxID=2698649 RepID=A0ABX2FES4_9PSEU|nr:DUF3105 domain-containing protein [Kibdelosporangium persicum]NRN69891.1 hypothetical protein [Kibdelosporangium persicum]